jgi:ring-1,2-phenylacetyl-CoA epoxidase subunit PaaE
VVQDGRRRGFSMTTEDESVLAAAERAGLELPYSCRSGVCSTCRVKVIRGTVAMTHNVALEEWELAAGYALACQARPTGGDLELSYDEK